MQKFIGLSCVALVLCFASGCGSQSAEALFKDNNKLMNDYADAVEKKEDAKAKEIDAKITENNKKLEGMKVSEEEKKKIMASMPDYPKSAIRYAGAKMGSAMKDAMKDKTPGKK